MRKININKLFGVVFCFEGALFLLFNLIIGLNQFASFTKTAFYILIVQAIILGLVAWKMRRVDTQKVKSFLLIHEGGGIRPIVSTTFFVLSVLIWTILLLFIKQVYLIYFQSTESNRLILNFIGFLMVLELELFFCLPIFFVNKKRFNFNLGGLTTTFAQLKKNWKATIFTFIMILITVMIIALTGAGINPDNITIIDLGVPLLESQILYGIGLIILMIWTDYGYGNRWFFNLKTDSGEKKIWTPVIFLSLWVVTFLTWNFQEIPIFNNFVIGNIPPNYEFFPYSDAKYYDKSAILMMLGDGQGEVFTRVVYVFFLSLAHSIVGFDYTKIIFVQTLFLSMIPSILYLVGKEMHSNGVGIVIGLFAMFRELNAILAGNLTTVSNSKLLLSDVPTLLIVSIIALSLIRWLKRQSSKPVYSVLLGGWMGIGILLRTQMGFVVPIVLLVCLGSYWGRWDQMIKKTTYIVVGLTVVLLPVLIRNYQISGAIGFDEPGYVAVNLTRFDLTGEFFNPNPTSSGGEIYKELLLFIVAHPDRVLGFTFNHFLRNVLSAFYVFPVRLEQITSWKDLFFITTPFWKEVNLNNGVINSLLIVFNLFVFFTGLSVSQKKQRWPTLAIIGLFVFYAFGSSIGRFSGWRFVLPVDWVGYTFLVIGLTELLLIFSKRIFNISDKTVVAYSAAAVHQNKCIYFQLAILLFFGWGSIIQEQLSSRHHYQPDRGEVCSISLKSLEFNEIETVNRVQFFDYCMDETTIIKQGIGVYPEYFEKNTGYTDANEKRDLETKKDFSRFFFVLFDEGQTRVYVRTKNTVLYFPNGGNVIAFGRKGQYGFEADAVFFDDHYQNFILSDTFKLEIDPDSIS